MKLEAKTRLLLTAAPRKLVTKAVQLFIGDEEPVEFATGAELEHWVFNNRTPGFIALSSFPIGHYLVVIFSNNKVGVAKAYQSLWVDTDGPKPGTPSFQSVVVNGRAQIKQALEALKRAHHPKLAEVTREAKTVLAFYDKHAPEVDYTVDFSKLPQKKVESRRTQGWFHQLSAEEQDEYCKKFPGTRFRLKRGLVAP